MLRLGVMVVLAGVLGVTLAGFEYGAPLQRLRRSPHYECPPPFYPPPHRHYRHWPSPYGPPPYGPPPFGPPPFGPPPPPEFGPPPPKVGATPPSNYGPPPPESSEEDEGPPGSGRSQALTQQNGNYEDGGPSIPQPPCDKCDKKQNTAVSNAQSGTGPAIAIAISGKSK